MKIPVAKSYSIGEFVLDEDNPNVMSDKQLEALKEGIKRYGFLVPVITGRGMKVADGHQRLTAAKALGMTEVPAIVLDVDEPDRIILQQVMNKLRGEHNEDRDAIAFRKLLEAERLTDVAKLLAVKENRLLAIINKATKNKNLEDAPAVSPQETSKVKLGDVWKLGDHIIVCGDSTSPAPYKALFKTGETADMVMTDPPYGVSYSGDNNPNGKDWGVMANDDLRGDDLKFFLNSTYRMLFAHTKPKAPMYCFYASSNHIEFETAMKETGWRVKQQLIWDKGHILGHSDYHWAHEPMLYAVKNGQNCDWLGDRTQKTIVSTMEVPEMEDLSREELLAIVKQIKADSTVWDDRRDNVQGYFHPTQKPTTLAQRAIKNSTRPGDVVLEPFSGSGSTLMACEVTGRKCRAIELNPVFVAVAIKRYEEYTGKKAERLSS